MPHDRAISITLVQNIQQATVKFVGLRGKTAELNWSVPLDRTASAAGTVGRAATESVELTAPLVAVRGVGNKERDSDAG